uniref:Glycosyltransferase family 92 protein n=1 Tax=Caenorhabditis tropicalis TaxID=1561998 RepID=A0A1I7THJ7_9PELO
MSPQHSFVFLVPRHFWKLLILISLLIFGYLLARVDYDYVPRHKMARYDMEVSEKDPSEVFIDIGGGTVQMGRMQHDNFTYVEVDDPAYQMNSTTCRVEPWNNVHSDRLPYPELHEYWLKQNISRNDYLYHKTPSPLAAFAHPEHITVTLTAENITVTNPNVMNLQFKVEWVLKDTLSPARYESDSQFFENLVFRKFHNTSRVQPWLQPKSIVRPERIGAMTIHLPIAVYKGLVKIYLSSDIGVIRHYRNVDGGALLNNNQRIFEVGPYSLTDIEPNLKFKLTDAVIQISKELTGNSGADDFLDPEADKFLECPIDVWNAIETGGVPFGDFEVVERWKKQRVNKFHPTVLNALLFDDYIMVLIDTTNMSGRHVVCRYFDCLRREIPSQFESKIYPESVVYCPRRIGVHWMTITGNTLEKPTRPVPIENSSLSTFVQGNGSVILDSK